MPKQTRSEWEIDGPALKKLRDQSGMQQQELATKAQVEPNTVSRWERHGGRTAGRQITLLAKALDAQPSAFARRADGERGPIAGELPIVGDRNELVLAGVTVPDIRVEFDFTREPLDASRVRGEFLPEHGPHLPPALTSVRDRFLDERAKIAVERGETFDNNPAYGLFDIVVRRPTDVAGKRRRNYVLRFVPTSYFEFVFPHSCLDQAFEIDGKMQMLRSFLGLHRDTLTIEDFRRIRACGYYAGTVTIVVTSDRQVLVARRAARQAIVPGPDFFHASTQEGTLRRMDVDGEGKPSIFETSLRSIEDELGLFRSTQFDPRRLRLLAILLDVLRAQPLFVFYLETDQVNDAAVKDHWKSAKDAHENRALLSAPWTPEVGLALTAGSVRIGVERLKVASNHAQAAFAIAARHAFPQLQ